MRLKAFEKRVQGPIEEAKVTSVPTQEAIDLNSGIDAEVKNAKDSASTFIDESLEKVKSADTEEEKRRLLTDLVRVLNQANQTTKKGAEEVKASLNDPKFEQAKKASDEFETKHGLQKAEVETPRVHVVPATKPVLTETKKEEPKAEVPTPTEAQPVKKEEPKNDGVLHEVKATKETSSFFKKHKKGILIATGLGMCALTGVLVPTVIIPALMHANSIVAAHSVGTALASAMHGINTSLGGFIGAAFDGATGIWTLANGTAINAAAAKSSILCALGNYGLWSVYGFGLVKSFKNMIKAVDLPSPKKETEKAPLSVRVKQALEDLKGIDEPVIKKEEIKEPQKEKVTEEKKETPKTEEVKPVVVEQPKEEEKTETFELPVAPTKTVTPVVEDVVRQNQRNKVFGDMTDEDFLRMIEDLQKQKQALTPTDEATKGMRM